MSSLQWLYIGVLWYRMCFWFVNVSRMCWTRMCIDFTLICLLLRYVCQPKLKLNANIWVDLNLSWTIISNQCLLFTVLKGRKHRIMLWNPSFPSHQNVGLLSCLWSLHGLFHVNMLTCQAKIGQKSKKKKTLFVKTLWNSCLHFPRAYCKRKNDVNNSNK